MDWQHREALDLIRRALEEDIGAGDVTTELTVPGRRKAAGGFFAREPLTVAGIELMQAVYDLAGGGVTVEILTPSGTDVAAGTCLARAEGNARRLLTCERTALNLLQRLCGVATLARRFARAVEGTGCQVLDTRKTTPGMRRLEKMAAACGGVVNHRMGLYDAVLIKNNHITAAGGVKAALEAVRRTALPVEIEVRTPEELEEALACGASRLLLDNLTPEEARQWICRIGGRATVELSGGITLDNARAYAMAGAQFISSGAITHSARAVDIHFRLELHASG
ncbi:MAG: carboxylating nicotinate-nucleotide diphosphorylase [Bryobacteraceae bacterium]